MAELHDVAIVGAGPVGAALALAIAEADLDVVALDARAQGDIARGDRALAISHGGRLILERLAVWAPLAALRHAVTPIDAIDISQAGGFGTATLTAKEQDVPALGYVVSYRALTGALDDALARTRTQVRYGASVQGVRVTPAHAEVTLADGTTVKARLVVVADGAGAVLPGITRARRDYGQVALIAKVATRRPHAGVAFERFTDRGPMALLPEGDRYGLVWTMPPADAQEAIAWPEDVFLTELARHFGARRDDFIAVSERRQFPLVLEFARPTVTSRCILVGNAAQTLHPVAGQGFNLGLRDAYELARHVNTAAPESLGGHEFVAAYAAQRSVDRRAGIAVTHGLAHLFARDSALLRWPRGIGLAILDAVPPAKRAFTRAMMYGL